MSVDKRKPSTASDSSEQQQVRVSTRSQVKMINKHFSPVSEIAATGGEQVSYLDLNYLSYEELPLSTSSTMSNESENWLDDMARRASPEHLNRSPPLKRPCENDDDEIVALQPPAKIERLDTLYVEKQEQYEIAARVIGSQTPPEYIQGMFGFIY